jgi:hypothetical protein
VSNINGDHRKCGAKHATHRVLQVEILGGKHNRDSELAFIPRITLIPCQPGFSFRLRRFQFPVRLQFVRHIGLDLQEPVFSWTTLRHPFPFHVVLARENSSPLYH